jgi:hypothetical protein
LTIEQMGVVASLIAVCGALGLVANGYMVRVALAGTLVQAALACRLALLRLARRDACRDLIIAGRDRLPLRVLERESCRLRSRRCREQLARLLEAIPAAAARPRSGCTVGSLVNRRAVSSLAPLLWEVATLLRSDVCSVPGVALTEHLVTYGSSALYGADADALRRELGRIRMLLSERSGPRPPTGP